ncbi:MAG: hypothetical protein V4737_11565 [Curtobacterium sp.]
MPSGGARARSGPAPDPNALRRDRKTDAEWTTLPAEGYQGPIPEHPLPANPIYDIFWVDKQRMKELDVQATEAFREREVALWEKLWRRPQAVMWMKLGLEYEVASYARAYLESNLPDAVSGMKTATLRMAAELGLSLPGMHSLRWKIADDELSAKRAEAETTNTRKPAKRLSARDRLKAVGDA